MGTRYQGTADEQRALSAFINLIRAAESVLARLKRRRSAGSLTMSQFMTMDALYFIGPLTQKELGAKILKSGGNMTMVIDNLERGGLVRRERNARDRRAVTVCLTPKGKRLMEELIPVRIGNIVEEMSVLAPEEQEALRRLCRAVGRGADG